MSAVSAISDRLRSSVVAVCAMWVGDPKHGPLPALLLLLTMTTGVIDAVSILGLGRVFVANMTGNVAFIGFALAGAPGFSLAASLAARGGFLAMRSKLRKLASGKVAAPTQARLLGPHLTGRIPT